MATTTPRVQTARRDLVARLAGGGGGGKVLSLYLDLNPTDFATAPARESQIHSLTNRAEAMVEDLDQPDRSRLHSTVEEVRRFLSEDDGWTKGARAVAVFAGGEGGLFEVVKLLEPVAAEVFIEDRPHLLPVRDTLQQDRWCVVLVDRRSARIFLGTASKLTEYDEVSDDVHGRHNQGGWSQARYGRSVEEEVEEHLQSVSDRLLRLQRNLELDHILIGTSEELWPRIRDRLHAYVSEDVIGRVDADIRTSDAEELQAKVRSVQAQLEHSKEEAVLGELRRELAVEGRAASGVPQVLDALNAARAGTLLIAEGAAAAGTICPKCGYLSESAQTCPVDDATTEHAENVLEQAILKAGETGAEVVVVRQPEALGEGVPAAAILRF